MGEEGMLLCIGGVALGIFERGKLGRRYSEYSVFS